MRIAALALLLGACASAPKPADLPADPRVYDSPRAMLAQAQAEYEAARASTDLASMNRHLDAAQSFLNRAGYLVDKR